MHGQTPMSDVARPCRQAQACCPGFGLSLGFTCRTLPAGPASADGARAEGARSRPGSDSRRGDQRARDRRLQAEPVGASLAAACVNAVFGLLVAWVLVRYRFPGRRLVDACVDLPFALPDVGGRHRPDGRLLAERLARTLARAAGIQVAFTRLGVLVALTFIGLPFVVRAVQPVLEDLDPGDRGSGGSLGATRWQTFRRVLLPVVAPALLTGFTLAFARALGEYGSVIFISGNLPLRTEIMTLLIVARLEQFDYAGATAIAAVMLGVVVPAPARDQPAPGVDPPKRGAVGMSSATTGARARERARPRAGR